MNSSAIGIANYGESKHLGNTADESEESATDVLDVHAVILTNYVRAHHVLAFKEFSKRVRKLTVLLSVPMEPDRDWDAEWGDLDVQVQRNFMWTAKWKHSSGFSEANFIHIPIDTPWRLWKLKPDIIFSYEMGFRTLFSSCYRLLSRKTPLVMVGNMSEHIEKERGFLRRSLRKLICRTVDYFTYNGPSCERYLRSLGIHPDRLFHFPYCINGATVFRGEREDALADSGSAVKLLYCGAISERKGILQFTRALADWCKLNSDRKIELLIAGSGELQEEVASQANDSLKIQFLGNCDVQQLRTAYGESNICVFPSLADEWGLVPIEAMASGLPILGSIYAQSVESCCIDSVNGWVFDPNRKEEIVAAIDRALSSPATRIHEMGVAAQESVAHITPETSGQLLAEAVSAITGPCNPRNWPKSAT